MRLHKLPCAAFIVKPEVMTDVDRELSERLARSLSRRFPVSPAQKHWSFPYWAFDLTSGRDRFILGIRKSQWQGQWLLMIHPGNGRLWLALMRQPAAIDVFALLLTICREIHVLLAETAGITNIRWYFTKRGPTTATPEQLFEIKYKQEGWTGP